MERDSQLLIVEGFGESKMHKIIGEWKLGRYRCFGGFPGPALINEDRVLSIL